MPPVVPLFILAVLILAQLFHLVSPGRISYLRRILIALVGVTVAEWAGSHLLTPGPRLGDLHPLWDLVFTAPLQLLANRLLR
jgi:hypothetical protein